MANLNFNRVAKSAALLALSVLFASSAFADDSHDLARRLIQPVVAVPAVTTSAGSIVDAHHQAVALIATGSAQPAKSLPASTSTATAGSSDPHQFARDHLRWTIAAN